MHEQRRNGAPAYSAEALVAIVVVARWEYLASESGFAASHGPNGCGHRVPSEGAQEGLLIRRPGNHPEIRQLCCMISIKSTPDVSGSIWQVCFTLRWVERGCVVPRGMQPPEDGLLLLTMRRISENRPVATCQLAHRFARAFLGRFQQGLRMRPYLKSHRHATDTP